MSGTRPTWVGPIGGGARFVVEWPWGRGDMADGVPEATERAAPARRSRRRLVRWALSTLLLLLLATVAWIGIRGLLAKSDLEAAVPLAKQMQGQIVAGDTDAARATFERMSAHAESAAALTSDPVWRAGELVPFVGPNLAAVRELAAVVDDVSRDGIGPLTQAAAGIRVEDFKPADGSIALQPLIDARPAIASATTALTAAGDRVASIDTSPTVTPVREAVARLGDTVTNASLSIDAVDRALRLLPPMLGSSGPRDYLLLFQNPAELRAGGGVPSALALVHTENGRMTLTQQASSSDFPRYRDPVLDLPADTRSLYGESIGQFIQDVSLTPRFDLTARLAREMWNREFGLEVDGVISIDPVALGYLLDATGPIALPSGDVISSENVVRLLLVDVYARFAPAEQDAFFASAAASVFAAISTGDVEPTALITALARAGSEHRVLLWNAREQEQTVLDGTTLAGGPPISDARTLRFGVYLNDATTSKMDPYLDTVIEIGQATCRKDERANHLLRVSLSNIAPADSAAALPRYVTGLAAGQVPGVIATEVNAYGVPGMVNLGVRLDGEAIEFQPATDLEYPVSSVLVELAPGQRATLEFGWLGEAGHTGDVEVITTPTVYGIETNELGISCESGLW